MKKQQCLIVILMMLLLNALQAQTQKDSIVIYKNRSFSQNGQKMTYNELFKIVSLIPETKTYREKAIINNVSASILTLTGGALFCFPIGILIAGGELKMGPLLVGGGLILASIPFARATKENMIKAVRIYNRGLMTSYKSNSKLEFGLNSSGIGLVLKF